ncbi:glycine--tRNA ligase subunit beta, partial [Mesotoga sp.]|uniref:glycine--tRNA ligase subunit beta n=1 Tax=Mesotoga sp. TaxID=2053577 RepID=UPI0035630F06
MSDHKALLEVGIEELPSSEVQGIKTQLKERIERSLDNNRLGYGELQVFVASRRFGVIIRDIELKQSDFVEKKKGPSEKIAYKEGEPTRALLGFLRGSNAQIEDVSVEDGYVYVQREIIGK